LLGHLRLETLELFADGQLAVPARRIERVTDAGRAERGLDARHLARALEGVFEVADQDGARRRVITDAPEQEQGTRDTPPYIDLHHGGVADAPNGDVANGDPLARDLAGQQCRGAPTQVVERNLDLERNVNSTRL